MTKEEKALDIALEFIRGLALTKVPFISKDAIRSLSKDVLLIIKKELEQ